VANTPATIGWAWHPVGIAYSFNLKNWMEGSKWESDSSPNTRSYATWEYFWDSPFFWIDDKKLCIWGSESQGDDAVPSDTASIYDARSEELIFSFNGPTADIFFFDEYLFSGLKHGDAMSQGLSDGSLLSEKQGKKL
jgi:hypothetical protein